MKARVHVTLKSGVLDPQGRAIQHALGALGFRSVKDVRQGKYIEIDLANSTKGRGRPDVRAAAANTVIENYAIELVD
jgi:phosphoribosylformylglycinamidine synthase